MNFKVLMDKAGFVLQQTSPEILLGSSIILSIAAVITACSKMKETDKVKEELQEELEQIDEVEERGTKEHLFAGFKAGGKAVLRYIVIFWIPILLMILSILASWYSHGIMVRRNTDLASAVIVLTQQMDKYRERVRNKVGVETENDLFYNLTKTPSGETITITDENGKEKKVKQFEKTITDGAGGPFDRIFDRTNPNWTSVPGTNLITINAILEHCRDMLRDRASKYSDGWITLNEVYEKLGFEPTETGFNYGWTFSRRDPNASCFPDIDFGTSNCADKVVKEFIGGKEPVIPLHFNCKPIDIRSLNLLKI